MINQQADNKLAYFDLIQKDLLSSPTGGLLIMSQGTGVYKVIGEYLDQFDKGSQTIFFLLNFDDRDSLKTEANEIQHYTKRHKIVDVSNLISTKRSEIYNKGGVFSVSDVILLFDLLSGSVIHSERITGFIINRIHSIRDSKEHFVWLSTLLKMNNPSAIILGITECEQTLASRGLENIMKWFYITRCFVWNMIRAEVQNEIISKDNQCEQLDTCVDMNKRMKNIDNCIKVIIILILNSLKAKKNINDTYESPIFTEEEFLNSHQYILEDKIKSNKMFHRACLNNLQYFKDAFNFKQLQKDLFQLNCVQFYSRLLHLDYNSTEESFINRTQEDKKTQKVIKELFENAQKRVYELQKSDKLIDISIKESYITSRREKFGQTLDNKADRKSDNFIQQNTSDLNLINKNNQNENSLGLLSQIKQIQDDNPLVQLPSFDNLVSDNNSVSDNNLNNKIEILDNQDYTEIRQSDRTNSFSHFKNNDIIEISQKESQWTSKNNVLLDEKLDQSDFLVKTTQKVSISSVKEVLGEDDDYNNTTEINQGVDKKQDTSCQQHKNNNQQNINLIEDSQNIYNKDEQLIQKMNFMINMIEKDPNSLFIDEEKIGDGQDFVIIQSYLKLFYIFRLTSNKLLYKH